MVEVADITALMGTLVTEAGPIFLAVIGTVVVPIAIASWLRKRVTGGVQKL